MYKHIVYSTHKRTLYTLLTLTQNCQLSISQYIMSKWIWIDFFSLWLGTQWLLSQKNYKWIPSLGFLEQRTHKTSTRAKLSKSTSNSDRSEASVRNLFQFLFIMLNGSEYTPTTFLIQLNRNPHFLFHITKLRAMELRTLFQNDSFPVLICSPLVLWEYIQSLTKSFQYLFGAKQQPNSSVNGSKFHSYF